MSKPTQGLIGMTYMDYVALKGTGMLYEFHPSATGNYTKDCSIHIKDTIKVDLGDPAPVFAHSTSDRAKTTVGGVYDAGLHYRKFYKDVQLDPFRIGEIYKLSGIQLTILKKVLVVGDRGHKSKLQDYKDIINAATRAIEMIEEDEK